MPAASCSQGALSSLYVEPGASTHTFDSNSERYEFWRTGLRKNGSIIDGDGIRGTRSAAKENIRSGPYSIGGPVSMNFSPGMLANWLPRILGEAASGTTFAVKDSLATNGVFGCLIGYDSNETIEYKDCMVNQALFHAKAAGPDDQPNLADLTLDIWGLTSSNDTSLPSVDVPTATNYAPFIFSDAVLTLLSATREVFEWWVLVDNHLHRRWVNSVSATRLCPRKRTVMVRAVVPYDSANIDLYDQAIAGAAGTLALTNGTISTSFAFANLAAPSDGPQIVGKTELELTVQLIARTSGATKELIVTNDSTV